LANVHIPVNDSEAVEELEEAITPALRPGGINRWVDQRGSIGLGRSRYRVGATFAGESVEVLVRAGLVEIFHSGVLVATHAERRRAERSAPPQRATRQGRSRPPTSGLSVSRIVCQAGTISFASTDYRVGRSWIGTLIKLTEFRDTPGLQILWRIWLGLPAHRTTIEPNARPSCGLARYSGACGLRCQDEFSAQVVC
jgi:hypothetical protein